MSAVYALSDAFEKVVVAFLVTDARFVQRIGSSLEAKCFPSESAKLLVSSALLHLKESGRPLTSAATLMQRIRILRDKGQLDKDAALTAADYIDDALSQPLPDREEVIHELAIAVKRLREGEILEKADKIYSKNGSISEIRDELAALDKLGKAAENPTISPLDSFAMIRDLRRMNRLTTGCSELDALIGGGPARGQMAYALGGTGSGKSQFLSQVAQAGILSKVNTLVATLEVNVADWYARVFAGITEVPQRAISDGEMDSIAEDRFRDLIRRNAIGSIRIRDFPAKVTQIEEIFQWVDDQNAELAAALGDPTARYELLVIDYLDKLGFPPTFGGTYDGMGHVYEFARLSGHERKMWLWTASQSKGKDKQHGKLLDADDSADSKNKGRVTDLCITLNVADDNSAVNIFVAKNRTGDSRMCTGNIPTDFPFGRLTRPTTVSMFEVPTISKRPAIPTQEEFAV